MEVCFQSMLGKQFFIQNSIFQNFFILTNRSVSRKKETAENSIPRHLCCFPETHLQNLREIKPLKSSQVMPIQTLLLTANLNKFRHNTIQNPTFVRNFSAHPNMGAKPKTINHHETLKQINANPTLNPIFAYDKPSKMAYRFR